MKRYRQTPEGLRPDPDGPLCLYEDVEAMRLKAAKTQSQLKHAADLLMRTRKAAFSLQDALVNKWVNELF